METKVETTTEMDEAMRKRSGWLVAISIFILMYAILAFHGDGWGLALGWLPSTLIASAFGWIVYCFPRPLEVVPSCWNCSPASANWVDPC